MPAVHDDMREIMHVFVLFVSAKHAILYLAFILCLITPPDLRSFPLSLPDERVPQLVLVVFRKLPRMLSKALRNGIASSSPAPGKPSASWAKEHGGSTGSDLMPPTRDCLGRRRVHGRAGGERRFGAMLV